MASLFTYKRIRKQKETALVQGGITSGFATRADYSMMDEFWQGAPWQKRKTLIVTYEYLIGDKRCLKNVKFTCYKGKDGTFRVRYPYKIRIYYSTKKSKILHWEKDEKFEEIIKQA